MKRQRKLSTERIRYNWSADGKDIYYKGIGNEQTPVEVKISYKLDGKNISAENIIGKSGKAEIKYEFVNNRKTTEKVNGKKIEVYVPFITVSASIFDSDKFSDVEVTNGKVISDGNRIIVAGMAFPGLSQSLGFDGKESEDFDIEIPDSFTIRADVKNFETTSSIIAVTNQAFSEFNFDGTDSIEEITEKLNEINDAAKALCDGTGELYKGTGDLADGTESLSSGTDTLYNGSKELDNGAKKLSDGTSKLTAGAKL